MRHHKKVEFLAIGDELLLGLRDNSHLGYLGEELARCGLRLGGARVVPDQPNAMRGAFLDAWENADLVVVSGGLGPTSDDLTCDVIADSLGVSMHHDSGVEKELRSYFSQRGREPSENNFRQCRILDGAQVLHNANGTAPGQWFASDDGRVVVLLPGPPKELRPMFAGQVLPRLQRMGWAKSDNLGLEFRTMGMGESLVATTLSPLLEPLEDRVSVAYCAHTGVVDVRLQPLEDDLDSQVLKDLGERCREALGEAFLDYGQPDPAGMILSHLRNNEKTLAVVESCTGGLLASRFTDIPGASKVLMGGMVLYRNEAKELMLDLPGCLLDQHGAVSAECAAAMATAVAERMEADYALSITGFAGPEGGREPAGTVYIGYHSPTGIWSRKEVFPGSRSQVKERTVAAALNFLRLQLGRNEVSDLIGSL